MDLLKDKFPSKHPVEHYHHMTVLYKPNEKDIEEMDDLLDNNVTIRVIGIAEDEHCQAVS